MPSPGTSPLGTDAHPSGIRSCPLDSCSSFCFSNHAGVIPEHLIKRYDVPERVPKGKTGPALHNADTEQKRPRRKDTPALHMPPFVAGKFKKKKKAGTEHSQEWWEQIGRASPSGGGGAWPVSWPCKLLCTQVPLGKSALTAAFQVFLHWQVPRDNLGVEETQK